MRGQAGERQDGLFLTLAGPAVADDGRPQKKLTSMQVPALSVSLDGSTVDELDPLEFGTVKEKVEGPDASRP